MAKKCPINKIEALIEARPIFKAMVDKYKNLPSVTPISLYNILYRKLSEASPPDSRFNLGDLFLEYLKAASAPAYIIHGAANTKTKLVKFPKELDNIYEDFGEEISAWEDAVEGSDPNDGETQDITNFTESGTSKHFRDGGEMHFKDIMFGAIGDRVSTSEYKNIVDKARDLSTNDFIEFLVNKYPFISTQKDTRSSQDKLADALFGTSLDKIQSPYIRRNLVSFYNSNQKLNRLAINPKKGSGKIKLYRTNVYPTKDGLELTGAYNWAEAPKKDPVSGRKNPDYEFADFVHTSIVLLGGLEGKPLGKYTYTIDTKNIVKYQPSKKSGKLFPRNVASKIDSQELHSWLLELSIFNPNLPLTIVGAKPGDSSSFYVSPVFLEYFDIIMPRDKVKIVIEASNLSDKTKKFFADRDYQAFPILKEMQRLMQEESYKTSSIQAAVSETHGAYEGDKLVKAFDSVDVANVWAKAENEKLGTKDVEKISKKGKKYTQVQKIIKYGVAPLKMKDKNALRLSRKAPLGKMGEIYKEVATNLKKVSLVGYESYLQQELDSKYIDDDGAQDLRNSIKPDHIPMSKADKAGKQTIMPSSIWMASQIARHEWFKAVRYNTYSKEETVQNVLNRMRLPMAQGTIVEDAADRKLRILDLSKITMKYEGKTVNHMVEIKGIQGKKNIGDGAQMADTATLEETTEGAGRFPITRNEFSAKQIKTAEYKRSEDGNSYLEVKSETFLAKPGLAGYDKNTGALLFKVEKVDDDIVIYDDKGSKINRVATDDEAKTMIGDYSFDGNSFVDVVLKPENSRLIILPEVKAHNNATSQIQWAGSMNIDDKIFNSLRKVYGDWVDSMAEEWLTLLDKMHSDALSFKNEVKHRYNLTDGFVDAITKSMKVSDDHGIYHPDRLQVLTQSLLNTFIVNGALKGRNMIINQREGGRKRASSIVKFKPDWARQIKANEKAMIIGADNNTLFDYTFEQYLASEGRLDISNSRINALKNQIYDESFRYTTLSDVEKAWYDSLSEKELSGIKKGTFITRRILMNKPWIIEQRGLSKNDKIDVLNRWLETNKIKGLVGRNPILNITGVIVRKIKSFDVDGGNTIFLHPNDVFGPLTADSDGDTATVNLPGSEVIENIDKALSPILDKYQDTIADISMIKSTLNPSILDSKNFINTLVSLTRGINAQGITTNYQQMRGVLSMKYGNIRFANGTIVKPIKPTDEITVRYYEFKDDYPASNLPNFARFIEEDGKIRLVTQAHHADQLLVNTAVDHPKEHLISQTDFDGTKKWYLPYMFEVVEGEMTSDIESVLLKIWQIESLGSLRQGKDRQNNKLHIASWYEETITNLKLTQLTNTELTDLMNKTIKEEASKLTDIEIKSTQDTIVKRLLKKPIQHLKVIGNDVGTIPYHHLHYTDQKFYNAHRAALLSLNDIVMRYRDLDTKAWNDGNAYEEKFRIQFYKIFEKGDTHTKKYEENLSMMSFDYNEELFNFIVETKNDLKKLLSGKDSNYINAFMSSMSYNFLKPSLTSTSRNVLPPAELFHPAIYKEYMKAFDEFFLERDVEGKWKLSSLVYDGNKSGLLAELPNFNDNPKGCIK